MNLEGANPCSDGGLSWQGVRCTYPPDDCDGEDEECNVIYIQLPDYNLNGKSIIG